MLTIKVVLLATVGGLGEAFNPVLGALLLVPFGEIPRGKLGGVLPGLHYFIYECVVIAVILRSPRGVLAYVTSRLRVRRATAKRRAALR